MSDSAESTQQEPRYHYSREQDAHYRIDVWALAGDGSIVPKEWTEVPADQVPPNHRRDTLERDADEW